MKSKGKCTKCKKISEERFKWKGGLYCRDCRKKILAAPKLP